MKNSVRLLVIRCIFSCTLGLMCIAPAGAVRVVSLMPSYTDIIFDLGAGPELVGVSNFCDLPSASAKIERTGDYLRPNLEKIYSLKPDLIFAGVWTGTPLVRNLRAAGLRVVELPEEHRVEDIFATVARIAKELGRSKEAAALTGKMRRALKEVPGDTTRPSVYLEIDEGGWTVGAGSFLSDALAKAGGRNIFSSETKNSFQASWETVVKKDPEAVILLSGSKEEFIKRPLAGGMKAVANDRIYTGLNRNIFSRPAPGIMAEIKKLREWLNDF